MGKTVPNFFRLGNTTETHLALPYHSDEPTYDYIHFASNERARNLGALCNKLSRRIQIDIIKGRPVHHHKSGGTHEYLFSANEGGRIYFVFHPNGDLLFQGAYGEKATPSDEELAIIEGIDSGKPSLKYWKIDGEPVSRVLDITEDNIVKRIIGCAETLERYHVLSRRKSS